MDIRDSDNASATEEMAPGQRNSETANLVSSSPSTKPNYINVVNNLCALLFIGIISYCCFKDGVNLFSFHPLLMSIGWLVLMATAVNSITPGDLATEWMPIRLRSARHWVLQVLAGIIVLIGFLIILSNKIIHDKPHFATLHAKFGLAAFIFMLITCTGGLGVLYSLKLKQYLAPIYIKLTHSTVGLLTFSLGIITHILGTFSAWWSFGEYLRYFSVTLILLVMILTTLRPSLKIYFRLQEKLNGH